MLPEPSVCIRGENLMRTDSSSHQTGHKPTRDDQNTNSVLSRFAAHGPVDLFRQGSLHQNSFVFVKVGLKDRDGCDGGWSALYLSFEVFVVNQSFPNNPDLNAGVFQFPFLTFNQRSNY